MKVDKSQVVLWVSLVGLLSLLVVAIWFDRNSPPGPPTPARIKYLRDSLEMEYYRKAIEESYPFDHSKIPTNESNP
jgi:hypothetical protein